MTKQVMQYRVCDRCSGENPAVVTDKIVLNGATYELDLCQRHDDQLYSDFTKWADVGTKTSDGTFFDSQRKIAGPVVVAVKPPKAPDRPLVTVLGPAEEQIATREAPAYPPTANRWHITAHALERMEQRGFDEATVRTTAERPEFSKTDPREPSVMLHRRGDCEVAVNPDTLDIITVYNPTLSDAELKKAGAF